MNLTGQYEPEAWRSHSGNNNIAEEMKPRVRVEISPQQRRATLTDIRLESKYSKQLEVK